MSKDPAPARVVSILASRFGPLPSTLQTQIEQLNNLEILNQATVQAAVTDSLDSFNIWLDQQAS